MRSLRVGKIFGITAELHWSFLLVAFFLFLLLGIQEPEKAVPTIIFFFFLFLSVFLHELVHSVVSLNRGIKVRKIILLPIGGIALTEKMPEKAMDEFLIAVSGPLFNFFVVAAVLILVTLFSLPFPYAFFSGSFNAAKLENAFLNPLFTIFYVNLMLGAFNLFLPALPLDGGRVFRSLLSMRIGNLKATRIVATVSSFISIVLFIVSLAIGSIILMIISFFVLFGAKEEAHLVELKHIFKQIKTEELMEKKPLVLPADLPIFLAVKKLIARKKLSCIVDFGNNAFGVFDLTCVQQGVAANRPVANYAKPVESIDVSMPAEKVLEHFLTHNAFILPVTKNGALVGVISHASIENAQHFLKAKQFVGSDGGSDIKK